MSSEAPRLFFDVTKFARQRHKSGLNRVSSCLLRELSSALGQRLIQVKWDKRRGAPVEIGGLLRTKVPELKAQDWWLTPEVFAPDERRGFEAWLSSCPVRKAAIFHDAIPLRFPESTWPRSVQRFPDYLAALRRFDSVFCVSEAARRDLLEFSPNEGEGNGHRSTHVLHLGGDGFSEDSVVPEETPEEVRLLSIGIVEPRKNTHRLLEAARILWREGLSFRLTFVGRVNPHFGQDISRQINEAARAGWPVELYRKLDDEALLKLMHTASWCVFASRAEGFGLPVLESLHAGVPVVAAPVPSVAELGLGEADGVLLVDPPRVQRLADVLREAVTDTAKMQTFRARARAAKLPTWSQTTAQLLQNLDLQDDA